MTGQKGNVRGGFGHEGRGKIGDASDFHIGSRKPVACFDQEFDW